MKYQVIFERADDGTVWAYTPELPVATGCGGTIDEARASLVEGVQVWMEVAKERGTPIPRPSVLAVETLDVSVA